MTVQLSSRTSGLLCTSGFGTYAQVTHTHTHTQERSPGDKTSTQRSKHGANVIIIVRLLELRVLQGSVQRWCGNVTQHRKRRDTAFCSASMILYMPRGVCVYVTGVCLMNPVSRHGRNGNNYVY